MMNFIITYNMHKLINMSEYTSSKKQMLLEPLTCILRLSLLCYKPEGTKISIVNNSIQYQDSNVYQGFLRSWKGDNREDIHNLYHPILKLMEWYSTDDIMIQYFVDKCINGLKLLQRTYDEKTIVIHTFSHYIDILNKKDNIQINTNEISPLIEKFKVFWTPDEISMIHKIFIALDNTDNKITYMKCIEDILESKEQKVYEYVKQSSSSYVE